MSFFTELRRRKVFQVAAVYLVVAWLIMQVVDVVNDPLSLPPWFDTVVIMLLAVGLPIALVTSWAFDLAVVRDKGGSIAAEGRGRRIEVALFGLLLAAVGWIVYRESNLTPSSPPVLPNSIAVLPCDNFSPDPGNDYFAPGIHEEVLNQLAKIQALNVIARTSVLQYAGVARPITEIAQELNVGSVMECSVSYAEGRVAVAAQLIDAETGVHLWSERYNREFVDVFGIQSDIAMNIANALEAEFSLAEQENIGKRPTESEAAYALYLRAIAIRDSDNYGPEAVGYLDRATAIDPDFALAYGEKALRLARRGRLDPRLEPDREQLAREAAEKALALDPDIPSAHAALAALHLANGRFVDAEGAFEKAYRLSPSDTGVLISYGTFRRDVGQYDESARLLQRAADLDPAANRGQLAIAYRFAKDYQAARAAHRHDIALNPANPGAQGQLGFTEIAAGNPQAGLKQLQLAEELGWAQSPLRVSQLAYAYSRIGRQQDARRLFERLREMATRMPISDGEWFQGYLAIGDVDRAYERLQAFVDNPLGGGAGNGVFRANQYSDPLLEEPLFRELRDRLFVLP